MRATNAVMSGLKSDVRIVNEPTLSGIIQFATGSNEFQNERCRPNRKVRSSIPERPR